MNISRSLESNHQEVINQVMNQAIEIESLKLQVSQSNSDSYIKKLFANYEIQMANMFRGSISDYNTNFSKQLTSLKVQVMHLISTMK